MTKQYEKTALQIIAESFILEDKDFAIIEEMKDELKDVFLKSQLFRTRTEMEISVLNDIKHPTPDSKYWQAVREQHVMFENLVHLSYNYRKNQVEIKQLERKLKEEKDDLERELLQIEIERKTFLARYQEREGRDRIREIKNWHEIKEELKPHLVNGTDDCNTHQLESYTKRWLAQRSVMGDKGSPSENANLIGQLESGLAKVEKNKLLK